MRMLPLDFPSHGRAALRGETDEALNRPRCQRLVGKLSVARGDFQPQGIPQRTCQSRHFIRLLKDWEAVGAANLFAVAGGQENGQLGKSCANLSG
jgi:hypothetical protein